ncbi:hypothetical protein [Streptomyces sp. NPDC058441]|uniref:hypothetical protein n=1 Tax=Streptomyces sp. NPDC058441 TaxID=3346502 RepID=UPI00366209A0
MGLGDTMKRGGWSEAPHAEYDAVWKAWRDAAVEVHASIGRDESGSGWFAAGHGFLRADANEIRHVPPSAGARALDVGCALGRYAAELARLGYATLAVDWAVASVAAVRDRY